MVFYKLFKELDVKMFIISVMLSVLSSKII